VETFFSHRIVPVDATVSRIWGVTSSQAARKGITIPVIDGLIAATAVHHGHIVMTRNAKHFAPFGVEVLDPWSR
jgi:predicted nucleic acid-binding protein